MGSPATSDKKQYKFLIHVTGLARSGKDTVSGLIKKHSNVPVYELALALELKKECADATGVPLEYFLDGEYKETLRPLMQWWGTEFRQSVELGNLRTAANSAPHGRLYWVLKLHDEINRLSSLHNGEVGFVVKDVRYDHEVEFLAESVKYVPTHVYTLKVVAPHADTTKYSSHSSEGGVSEHLIDAIIVNKHSKEDAVAGIAVLEKTVLRWMRHTGVASLVEDRSVLDGDVQLAAVGDANDVQPNDTSDSGIPVWG